MDIKISFIDKICQNHPWMERFYPWMGKSHPWIKSLYPWKKMMDNSLICGCHPWRKSTDKDDG